jgi:hypothetical protein
MKPTFFDTTAAFRAWLAKNHATAEELLVGFSKKGFKRPSITRPESVDGALCYGWIDGVRKGNGTPVGNPMVELDTMPRFRDPAGLRARGVEQFDARAATFGGVVEGMEIAPDGKSLRPSARFARFVTRARDEIRTALSDNNPESNRTAELAVEVKTLMAVNKGDVGKVRERKTAPLPAEPSQLAEPEEPVVRRTVGVLF